MKFDVSSAPLPVTDIGHVMREIDVYQKVREHIDFIRVANKARYLRRKGAL